MSELQTNVFDLFVIKDLKGLGRVVLLLVKALFP